MPGYQTVRIVQPSDYLVPNEPIYGHIKSKKRGKDKQHPLFQDLKSRDMAERIQYERYLRSKDYGGNKLDSMKFIGSCNDIYNMHGYMSTPRQRTLYPEDMEARGRAKSIPKSSTMVFGKGEKKGSVQSENNLVNDAMLNSLRSSASEDNLYESVEMIHYLKTMQSLNRQKKTRSIQRTGHPLFDSLREEQAMKEPFRKTSSKKILEDQYMNQTSDGNSPSLSPSSSGDEYEMYPKSTGRLGRSPREHMFYVPHEKTGKGFDTPSGRPKSKTNELTSSESDEDFKIIPRPKFLTKGKPKQGQEGLMPIHSQRRRSDILTHSDESDSSFNSTLLR